LRYSTRASWRRSTPTATASASAAGSLVDMTCKNETLTHPPALSALLAARNCTDDAV
jgi:hypothetical protein